MTTKPPGPNKEAMDKLDTIETMCTNALDASRDAD
jgi:hypothetical protein